ncbi:hypothetical protein ACSVDM_21495 [Nocardia sp. JW2]|uniref:hypothetical protein n=1 Tax=Nocardia sp. JW2 TaxID=3450738 RepID=UPI003F427955
MGDEFGCAVGESGGWTAGVSIGGKLSDEGAALDGCAGEEVSSVFVLPGLIPVDRFEPGDCAGADGFESVGFGLGAGFEGGASAAVDGPGFAGFADEGFDGDESDGVAGLELPGSAVDGFEAGESAEGSEVGESMTVDGPATGAGSCG